MAGSTKSCIQKPQSFWQGVSQCAGGFSRVCSLLQGQDAAPRGNHHRSSSSHAALNPYGSTGPAARGSKHERGASAGGGPILDSAFGSRSGKVGGLKGKPLCLAMLASV